MNKIFRWAGVLGLCTVFQLSFAACVNANGTNNGVEEAFKAQVSQRIGMGKKVYFAAPMFSQADKNFNLEVVKILEDAGYQVFLPQRDGIEAALLVGKTEEELIKMIFELDAQQVKKADIVFMNIDGRVPDEGAAVELGMAYMLGKRCYGFKTDTHSVEQGMDMNPMISGCMIKLFKNFNGEKLKAEIRQYLSQTAL